ncbi:Kojibiose phosphorylase [Paenibacillus sp. CECT 9249]|uniref:glycoside hydrolase family 65 protein n=1 Tax=Paenibacillus sp. CECT 9249 TaxID=2845385 RepID=UPI001E5A9AAB|nr:glycoside hydrolase family 65 protein [Paenibacillus sp. CECT 9249]CAH0122141.1 Kojibiose phosphorylase [Paenibacillus sp. CECT 9249]
MKKKLAIYDQGFHLHYLNKYASLLTLGNGYLGIRGAYEEDYTGQIRGMYVAGVYNKATANEPAEIVNLPDITGMTIEIDGQPFSLLDGEVVSYERALHFETGELRREMVWKSKAGACYRFLFQRFVSKHDLHVVASKVIIQSLDQPARIKLVTGIDAQQTNFGKQHVIEESVRVHNEETIQGVYKTTESGVTVAIAADFHVPETSKMTFSAKNRQLLAVISCETAQNKPFVFEKIATVYTSHECDDPETVCLEAVQTHAAQGYDGLLEQSAAKWREFWRQKRVTIASSDEFDQTAMDFALYHIEIMTPAHDDRFSIGAKGLTGEGYKGHVFWDTEIFLAPFHLYTEPEIAKKLLLYRYKHLPEAKEKAARNGYEGALFPWESAFTGKEETPEFAAINIRTGTRQKVASALAEHHIVADIAFAVVQYYESTLDDNFMKNEGLALLKETARFWISRTADEGGKLSIHDVIGPDEYTEHVNNNAYTNYMAYYNVEKALYFMEQYQDEDPSLFEKGRDFLKRLYLPEPNDERIVPQDDTFLTKPAIDLTPYKQKQGSQAILLDYSRQEVNEMQILKQADVVMLLYLFPDLFSSEVVKKNLFYYEKHTIHDSSLSKAIHAIVASRCDDHEAAYRFFQEACLIDLGPNPRSSDEGIHAASLGAIWLAAVFGFANMTINRDMLALNPKLPANWKELKIPLCYQGRKLEIKLTHELCEITKFSGEDVEIEINGRVFELSDRLEVTITNKNG